MIRLTDHKISSTFWSDILKSGPPSVSGVLILLLLAVSGYARTDPNPYEFSLICESCHSELYKQWKSSYHAMSWEDSLFQDFYAPVKAKSDEIECLSCHAPIAWKIGDEKVMEPISREGVSCDYCHTLVSEKERGDIPDFESRAGGKKIGRTGTGKSIYHEIQSEPEFGSPEYCAMCHHLRNRFDVLIYSEYESWKKSSYARRGVTCRDCHMPESAIRASNFGEVRDDVSSHQFPGWRSEENLRRASNFTAALKASRNFVQLSTTVTNRGAGHTFPGGTPLRELVIRVTGIDESGRDLFEETPIRYGVDLEVAGEDSLNIWEARSILRDTRIPPDERRTSTVSIPREEKLDRIKVSLLYYPIPLRLVKERELEAEPLVIYERTLKVR